MKNLAAFLLVFWIFKPVFAFSCDKPVTGWHVNTYHNDRSVGYREDNIGIYFRCENGFTAGSYKNSDWKHSDYVGYTQSVGVIDITVGLVSGYKIEPTPVVIPSVKIGVLRVAYLPQAPNRSTNTTGWHFSFEKSFN